MTHLLDANVLVALTVGDHVHHDRASVWAATAGPVAVCPVVEGALLRFLVRIGESAANAQAVLRGVQSRAGLEFWRDDLSYAEVDLRGIRGHRQLTDAYLVALARSRGARLATLDQGLAAEHAAADLVPG